MPGSTASYIVQEGGQRTAQGAVTVALGKLMASLSCFLCFLLFQMVTIVLTSQEGGEVGFSTSWVGSYEMLGSNFVRVAMFKILSLERNSLHGPFLLALT